MLWAKLVVDCRVTVGSVSATAAPALETYKGEAANRFTLIFLICGLTLTTIFDWKPPQVVTDGGGETVVASELG